MPAHISIREILLFYLRSFDKRVEKIDGWLKSLNLSREKQRELQRNFHKLLNTRVKNGTMES